MFKVKINKNYAQCGVLLHEPCQVDCETEITEVEPNCGYLKGMGFLRKTVN